MRDKVLTIVKKYKESQSRLTANVRRIEEELRGRGNTEAADMLADVLAFEAQAKGELMALLKSNRSEFETVVIEMATEGYLRSLFYGR